MSSLRTILMLLSSVSASYASPFEWATVRHMTYAFCYNGDRSQWYDYFLSLACCVKWSFAMLIRVVYFGVLSGTIIYLHQLHTPRTRIHTYSSNHMPTWKASGPYRPEALAILSKAKLFIHGSQRYFSPTATDFTPMYGSIPLASASLFSLSASTLFGRTKSP